VYLEAVERHFARHLEEDTVGTLRANSRVDHDTNVEGVGAQRLPAWSTARTAEVNCPR
jgi:hypothetical protein